MSESVGSTKPMSFSEYSASVITGTSANSNQTGSSADCCKVLSSTNGNLIWVYLEIVLSTVNLNCRFTLKNAAVRFGISGSPIE